MWVDCLLGWLLTWLAHSYKLLWFASLLVSDHMLKCCCYGRIELVLICIRFSSDIQTVKPRWWKICLRYCSSTCLVFQAGLTINTGLRFHYSGGVLLWWCCGRFVTLIQHHHSLLFLFVCFKGGAIMLFLILHIKGMLILMVSALNKQE